jgi:hypothetical protein
MAPVGQASRQLWQTMPCKARQGSAMAATMVQGGSVREAKIGSGQASAQAPQKVHSPWAKSMLG